ncbi:MAG: hypothetical protein WD055_02195 [Candidatus Dependentiae bacterium]
MKRFMLISLMSCMFVGQAFCIDEPVESEDNSAVVAEGSDNAGWKHNANKLVSKKPVQWSLRGAQVGATASLLAGVLEAIDKTQYGGYTLSNTFPRMFASEKFWRDTAMGTCAGLGIGFIAYLLYDWYKNRSDTSVDKTSS